MGLPSYILPIMGKSLPLDPITIAWLAQLTTSFGSNPSSAFISALNTMVAGMRSDGSILLLDRFWIFAQENINYTYISIVNPASAQLGDVNTPTFTAGQGYTFNGIDEYLNTNYTPSTDGVNYTLNSATIGLYVRSNVIETKADIGAIAGGSTNASFIYSRGVGNIFYTGINKSAGTLSAANADSIGLYSSQRTASNLTTAYKDGASLGTSAVASSALTNFQLLVGALNNAGASSDYSTKQISCVFTGSGSINAAAFYSRWNTFRTTIGF